LVFLGVIALCGLWLCRWGWALLQKAKACKPDCTEDELLLRDWAHGAVAVALVVVFCLLPESARQSLARTFEDLTKTLQDVTTAISFLKGGR
jgi:hypothetical protein